MDAHYFWKLDKDPDPDAHLRETLDLDSNYNQNSRAIISSKWSRGGLWTLTMEACWVKMEYWGFFGSVVADSHPIDEQQDSDPDPH
jgi:hypothetical protein